MNFVLGLLITFSLGCPLSAGSNSAAPNFCSIELAKHTVLVIGLKNKKPETSATGFMLERGTDKLIITNDHFCKGLDPVIRIGVNEKIFVGNIIYSKSKPTDLCLIKPHKSIYKLISPLPLGSKEAIPGEYLLVHSFVNNPLIATRQIVRVTTGPVFNFLDGTIMIDGNINHGNSGSPVVNVNGEVVGVVAMLRKPDHDAGWYISLASLKAFLKESVGGQKSDTK